MIRIYRTGIKQYLLYTSVQTDKSMLVESLVVLAKNCSRLGAYRFVDEFGSNTYATYIAEKLCFIFELNNGQSNAYKYHFIVFLKEDV